MMRWTLLACCLLVFGGCKTLTPVAHTDAAFSAGDAPSAVGTRTPSAAGAKTELARGGFVERAAREDARDHVPATPAAGKPGEAASPHPAERAAPAPSGGSSPPAVESAGDLLRAPTRCEEPPAEQPALPSAPAASDRGAQPGETLPLPAGSPMRQTATNVVALFPAPVWRGDPPRNPRPARTLALPLSGNPTAGKPEAQLLQRPIAFAPAAPPGDPGPAADTVALPWLPAAAPQGEACAGSVLPLPALSPVRPGVTNPARPSSVPVSPWVADAQKENDRSAAELDRRARTQKEHEEQFQHLRRAFYRFLAVNPDPGD